MRKILLVLLLSAIPSWAHATIFWQDGMETTTTPFHYAPWFDLGTYTIDTNIKHSGTGSIRVNFPANCQNSIPQGQCGGGINRLFSDPVTGLPIKTSNAYRRAWFRYSGDSNQGAVNGSPGGTFTTYLLAYTKLYESLATQTPGTAPFTYARTWWTIGGFGGRELAIGVENVPVPRNEIPIHTGVNIQENRWYCLEDHQQMNDLGVANGVLEAWVDGVNVINRRDLLWRNSGAGLDSQFVELHFFRQGGGPGNMWWDDTATGDQRIGCGGAITPLDTTPPPTPVLSTSVSNTTITSTWPAVFDVGTGVQSYTLRRCTGAACVPTVTLAVVSPSTLSYINAGLANSTTYGYCLLATDGAALSSPCSSPIQYQTTGAVVAPAPPTLATFSATPTSLTVTHGPVTSTTIRVQFGNNAGTLNLNTVYPVASFVGGTLSITIPDGTQFECVYPRDAAGLEISGNQICLGPITGVPPLDTAPVTMGAPFPALLPAGTTSALFGVPISKIAACRADSVNRSYLLMDTTTTAVDMVTSNLIASATLTGLTNGSSTTRYIQCERTNSFGDTYDTITAATVTIAVAASTPDTTPPSNVTGVVATPVPGTTNISLSWNPATDNVGVAFYRIYIASGSCPLYAFSGSPVLTTSTVLTLQKNMQYCFKVEAVDTSGNASLILSDPTGTGTTTTSSVPDLDPPSVMQGLRVDAKFTASVLMAWIPGIDAQGAVYSELLYCAGAGCTNFVSAGARVLGACTILPLLPNTFYRVKGIHYDEAGNPSGGLTTPTYSAIIQFTTSATGPGELRPSVPFGFDRDTTSSQRPMVTGLRAFRP